MLIELYDIDEINQIAVVLDTETDLKCLEDKKKDKYLTKFIYKDFENFDYERRIVVAIKENLKKVLINTDTAEEITKEFDDIFRFINDYSYAIIDGRVEKIGISG